MLPNGLQRIWQERYLQFLNNETILLIKINPDKMDKCLIDNFRVKKTRKLSIRH